MIPALAQVSTLHAPFQKDVEEYAAAKCEAIEVWWGKLDGYLTQHRPQDARRLLELHGMTAPVASFQGGLLVSQGDARREAWQLFARRIDIARELGIELLVVSDMVQGPQTAQDIGRFRTSLRQAAEQAASAGVRLALEFQARSQFCNNLQTAVAIVEEVDSPHLGVCPRHASSQPTPTASCQAMATSPCHLSSRDSKPLAMRGMYRWS
jgi:4-hydroxyphenylpyruvate dioxygenase